MISTEDMIEKLNEKVSSLSIYFEDEKFICSAIDLKEMRRVYFQGVNIRKSVKMIFYYYFPRNKSCGSYRHFDKNRFFYCPDCGELTTEINYL